MMVVLFLNLCINDKILSVKWYRYTCNFRAQRINFECIHMINRKISLNFIDTNKPTILRSHYKTFLMCSKTWYLSLTTIILVFFGSSIEITIFSSILLNSWLQVSDWVLGRERYVYIVFNSSIFNNEEVILWWNSYKYGFLYEYTLYEVIFSFILNRYDLIFHLLELLIWCIIHLEIALPAS